MDNKRQFDKWDEWLELDKNAEGNGNMVDDEIDIDARELADELER